MQKSSALQKLSGLFIFVIQSEVGTIKCMRQRFEPYNISIDIIQMYHSAGVPICLFQAVAKLSKW